MHQPNETTLYNNGNWLTDFKLDIISMLLTNDLSVSGTNCHQTMYHTPPFTVDPDYTNFHQNRMDIIKSNPYFIEFFESQMSPEIKIDEALVDRLIKEKTPGFYCNVVKEGAYFKLISDNSFEYSNKFYTAGIAIQEKYYNIIEFLKYVHNVNVNNNFTPIDLNEFKLGRKNFLKEFRNFIKIVPTSGNASDFMSLHKKITDIILEEAKVKTMTHWDLYSFNKFFISFVVEEENIDRPYIKLYTRDSAEAAQLTLNLMDKGYVEILE